MVEKNQGNTHGGDESIIENLSLDNVNIFGGANCGGLVGSSLGDKLSNILDCSVTGKVNGLNNTGGLIGYSYGFVKGCYTQGCIIGKYYVGGTAQGEAIKLSSDNKAFNVRLAVFKNTLYAVWVGNNRINNEIIAKRLEGSSWLWAYGCNTLNYMSQNNASLPSIVAQGDNLYVSWSESGSIRVKSYNGVKWQRQTGIWVLTGIEEKSHKCQYCLPPRIIYI